MISYKREVKWIIFLFRCNPTLQTSDPLKYSVIHYYPFYLHIGLGKSNFAFISIRYNLTLTWNKKKEIFNKSGLSIICYYQKFKFQNQNVYRWVLLYSLNKPHTYNLEIKRKTKTHFYARHSAGNWQIYTWNTFACIYFEYFVKNAGSPINFRRAAETDTIVKFVWKML